MVWKRVSDSALTGTPPTFGSIPSLVTFAEETPENTVVYSLPISDADSTDIITLYTKSETSGYFAVDSSTCKNQLIFEITNNTSYSI